MIQHITLAELRGMTKQEGLILQGCGGDPQEWLDGMNSLLAEEGILLNGSQFRSASVFAHDGCTNILFPMEDVDLDVGKLATWRLQSHSSFGGTWLSDNPSEKFIPAARGKMAYRSHLRKKLLG